ncbi:hypothetical protein [Chlorobium phaeobacteroides]|nr:hypothetical protein [Chlorobium phaeobacteroides]MBV5319365.1 hypothetical protein [Chlorobium phaeobacteroides]
MRNKSIGTPWLQEKIPPLPVGAITCLITDQPGNHTGSQQRTRELNS